PRIRDLDPHIGKCRRLRRIKKYAFGIRDLKDLPLCVVEKKDLPVTVRVAGIHRGDVAAGFDHHEAAVAADSPGKALCPGIGKLAHDRSDLAGNDRVTYKDRKTDQS